MSELMTTEEYKVLVVCEEHWMRYKRFPIVSNIAAKTGLTHTQVVECLSREALQHGLDSRGIPWMDPGDNLSPRQLACIQLLLNISDKRTQTQKLKSLGISPSLLQGWKKQDTFRNVYQKRAEELFGEALPEVHTAMINMATSGDVKAAKMIYAKTGFYNERTVEQGINVKFVLIKVLEAIQKHVKDPAVLQAVAEEFNGILVQEKMSGIVQGELE
jgi:hypothetical protein